MQGRCEENESGAARVREISPFQFDEGARRHVQAQDQWLRERVLVKIEDKRLCKVSLVTTNTRIRFGEVCVYYLRNRSIHWNVRLWRGIKTALKQLPTCDTTQCASI